MKTAADRLIPLASLASPIIFNAMIREVAEVSTIIFVGRTGGAVPIGAATLGNMMCNITGSSNSHSEHTVSKTFIPPKIFMIFQQFIFPLVFFVLLSRPDILDKSQDSPSLMASAAPWILLLAKHMAQNYTVSPVYTHKGLRLYSQFPLFPSLYYGMKINKESIHVYDTYSSWTPFYVTGPRHMLSYSMAWRSLLKLQR